MAGKMKFAILFAASGAGQEEGEEKLEKEKSFSMLIFFYLSFLFWTFP